MRLIYTDYRKKNLSILWPCDGFGKGGRGVSRKVFRYWHENTDFMLLYFPLHNFENDIENNKSLVVNLALAIKIQWYRRNISRAGLRISISRLFLFIYTALDLTPSDFRSTTLDYTSSALNFNLQHWILTSATLNMYMDQQYTVKSHVFLYDNKLSVAESFNGLTVSPKYYIYINIVKEPFNELNLSPTISAFSIFRV